MSGLSAIQQFKEYLLQPEREDARQRLADPGYWGDTGHWVERALHAIESAVDAVARDPDSQAEAWLEAVIFAIESGREDFRVGQADPGGYGSATFAASLARARALLVQCSSELRS